MTVSEATSQQVAPPPAAPWREDGSSGFGARLMLVRFRMGWGNVAVAARECGLPSESWRNWEEGKEPRRLVTIAMAIAGRTGCDIDWLVYGPSRPGKGLTHRYVRQTVLGRPNEGRRRTIHRPDPGRPVSQTRPIAAGPHRSLVRA